MNIQHKVIVLALSNEDEIERLVEQVSDLFLWYALGTTREKIRTRLCASPDAHVDLLLDEEFIAAFAVCIPILLKNGESCLFRHGTIIHQSYRSHGFYKKLLEIGLARHKSDWHATRTQNPRVYETWRQIHGEELLPNPSRSPVEHEKNIAVELSHGALFERNLLISRNVYPEDRREADYHTCRNEEIRTFFQQSLGVHDAFLLLARMKNV